MGKRYPSQLSGGQRQRVGVARALAADPPLMLMDEPFGAIDPINRENLQNQFLRLQREIRKTIVFVTHDIDEAIKMGDRIAILREGGELVQYDTPDNILANPADDFVAQFVGADRGLKRLALTRLSDVELDQGTRRRRRRPDASRPTATLRDALSLMMTDSMRPLLVVDESGKHLGYVSIELINQALQRGRRADVGRRPRRRADAVGALAARRPGHPDLRHDVDAASRTTTLLLGLVQANWSGHGFEAASSSTSSSRSSPSSSGSRSRSCWRSWPTALRLAGRAGDVPRQPALHDPVAGRRSRSWCRSPASTDSPSRSRWCPTRC